MSEQKYLQYVHSQLDEKSLIKIQDKYKGLIPKEYYIFPCICGDYRSENLCDICRNPLCKYCTRVCDTLGMFFCDDHFVECPMCEVNCMCRTCRVSSVEYTCSICSEKYDIAFSCGCMIPDNNTCMICENIMDPITKERE